MSAACRALVGRGARSCRKAADSFRLRGKLVSDDGDSAPPVQLEG